MSNINCDCKGCVDRYVGCHSTCEKYKSFTKELEAEKKMIKDAKDKEREWKEHNGKSKDESN